jgi:hypothetical protein
MNTYHGKTIEHWENNAEEDYLTTPISVLKYITVLEEQAKQMEKELFTEGDVKIAIELANKNINRLSMKWTKEDIIREIKKFKTK